MNRDAQTSNVLTRYIDPNLLKLEDRQFDVGAAGERVIRDVVVSTEDIDSHRSIIRLKGWDLERYADNPILDWMHASTDHGRPSPDELIGQAVTKMTPQALMADLVFVPDELSNIAGKVYLQMKARILRGLSVSFMPKEYTWKLQMPDGEIVDEPDLGTDDGFLQYIQMMRAGARDLLEVTKQELVAIGVVMVPSNPNTLSNGIAQLRGADPRREAAREEARKPVSKVTSGPTARRGAVAFESYTPVDCGWDDGEAAARVRADVTDGAGAVDWARYRSAFGWYDEAAPDKYESYKLVHHDVNDDGWLTVRAGVVAAGAQLEDPVDADVVPAGDVEDVRAHLAQHFAEFGITPPWEGQTEGEPAEGKPAENNAVKPQEIKNMGKTKNPAPVAASVEPIAVEPVTAPTTNDAVGASDNLAISEEVKTNAMKAGAICTDAITSANSALEGTDEDEARKASAEAVAACDQCREAYGQIAPVEASDKGEGEGGSKAVAPSWVRTLTDKEDEPSQRGVVEAWKKSSNELVAARAMITKLEADVTNAKLVPIEDQMRAVLDAAATKITPAERESYEGRHYKTEGVVRTFTGTNDDISWLRSHMEALPERSELAPATAQATKPQNDGLDEEELNVARQFGISPAEFAAHKRSLAARPTDEDEY